MGEYEYSYKEIILSALLHDIGKFSQRTKNREYSSKESELKPIFCPYNSEGNYYSHLHVMYTYYFIDNFHDYFPEDKDVSPKRIAYLAAKHHLPENPLEHIISMADRISSGTDRIQKENGLKENENKYYEQPLLNVFYNVQFKKKKSPEKSYYPLGTFTPNGIFPEKDVVVSESLYEKLWQNFVDDFKKLKVKTFNDYILSLDTILERYTWCIPSSTIDEPDISLYDHLITTTAFASALYKFHEEYGNLNDTDSIKDLNTKKFLLVSGDLSGIQNYIFNLKSDERNAKLLRARSFELQLLSDRVAISILTKLDLPIFCNIMNAGGRFLLLLPNVNYVKDVLANVRKEIDLYFLKKYFGELSLNISESIEVSSNDLLKDNMNNIFAEIVRVNSVAKQKKFVSILNNLKNHFIDEEYNKITGNENVCVICEKRVRLNNKTNVCSVCDELIRIGGQIPKTKTISFERFNLGDYTLLPDRTKIIFDKEENGGFSLNNYIPGVPLIKIPFYLPMDENGVKTFEDLSKEATGDNKLAMFKADVDNLGAIFSFGLGSSVSISRLTSLSRMMNYFFSTYLNDLVKNKYKNIYIVFSGGDDLCLIGPWNDVIDFAIDFNENFRKFVYYNDSVTLSGAIVLFSNKYPLRSATRIAEDALDKSKSKEGKNNITMFGETVSWNIFKQLIDNGKYFEENILNDVFSKGLVYRLIEYSRNKKLLDEGRINKNNALWRAHFRYDIARNIEDKYSKEREKLIEIVEDKIGVISIASMYALYKVRKGVQDE